MKYRHEYKYIITSNEMELIKQRLKYLVPIDAHVNENGIYNISSLYFDDLYDRCFYENENGTDPREKFRIRIYNHSSERITLECKRKERGKTLKTSARLTYEECCLLMKGQVLDNIGERPEVIQKLSLEMLQNRMKPKVIVEYDRIPYVYKMGNVRITLDTNLASSGEIDKFLEGGYRKRAIMPQGLHLLEVKWDEFLPDQIVRACQIDNLSQTAYSKYYLCRKYNLGD